MSRTQAETDKRPFLFHKSLADAGPTRLTVDGLPRMYVKKDKSKANVVDVTLLPKGEQAQPVTLWCENGAIAEFFAGQEENVPFTVIAEGRGDTAVVTKVGSSVQPPVELPKRETEPPNPRSPARAATQHTPTPHDTTTRNGRADKEVAAVKIAVARGLALKTVCAVAMMRFKRDAEAAGLPPMPNESFWAQVTNLNISTERLAQTLPVDLTFERLAEMAKRKEVPVNEAQRGVEPPTQPLSPATDNGGGPF